MLLTSLKRVFLLNCFLDLPYRLTICDVRLSGRFLL